MILKHEIFTGLIHITSRFTYEAWLRNATVSRIAIVVLQHLVAYDRPTVLSRGDRWSIFGWLSLIDHLWAWGTNKVCHIFTKVPLRIVVYLLIRWWVDIVVFLNIRLLVVFLGISSILISSLQEADIYGLIQMSHGFLHVRCIWVSFLGLLLGMLRGRAIEGGSIVVVLACVDSINIWMVDIVSTFRDITASELRGATVAWCPHFNIFWISYLLMATVMIVVGSDNILITLLLGSLMYRSWLVHHNSLTITLLHHTLGSIIVSHDLSDGSLILVHRRIWTILSSHTISQALPGQEVLGKTLDIPQIHDVIHNTWIVTHIGIWATSHSLFLLYILPLDSIICIRQWLGLLVLHSFRLYLIYLKFSYSCGQRIIHFLKLIMNLPQYLFYKNIWNLSTINFFRNIQISPNYNTCQFNLCPN